jgi:hypothetical protein
MKKLSKYYAYIFIVVVFIVGIVIYLYASYSFRNIKEKIAGFYNNDPNIYLDKGIETKWEQMLTSEPNKIVQSEFNINEPKYAFVYYIMEHDDGEKAYSIETFYFKRKSLFSLEFEIEEVFTTDVAGKNLTFEEVVDLADSRNIREMQEEELKSIKNIDRATRWNNPTAEQQARDEEDRIVKYEYSLNNPSNTDSLEWWDSESGASNEYILVKSTGNKMLTAEELQMTRLPKNEDYLDKLFVWINDEQIIYSNKFLCKAKKSDRTIENPEPGGDTITLYDIPTDRHKKIVEYQEDTDNCLRDRMGLFEDEFIVLREESIDKYDLDGNLLSTTILSEELKKIVKLHNQIASIRRLKYDGKIATLGYVDPNDNVINETVELE